MSAAAAPSSVLFSHLSEPSGINDQSRPMRNPIQRRKQDFTPLFLKLIQFREELTQFANALKRTRPNGEEKLRDAQAAQTFRNPVEV